ncbi:MAG TPA: hypothetical protein VF498_20130 [Anaerolineales bacterium]
MNGLNPDFERYFRENIPAILIDHFSQAAQDFSTWFEREFGEPLEPAKLEKEHLFRYQNYLEKVGKVKRALINRCLQAVRVYVTWASETGQIPYKSLHHKPPADSEREPAKWLRQSEQDTLIQIAVEKLVK